MSSAHFAPAVLAPPTAFALFPQVGALTGSIASHSAACLSVAGRPSLPSQRSFRARPRTVLQFEDVPPSGYGGFYFGGDGDDDDEEGDGGSNNPLSLLAVLLEPLRRRPILAKALFTAAMTGLGDVLAQMLEARNSAKGSTQWNARRTAALTFFGFIATGPLLHGWYATLARLLPSVSAANTLRKVLLDQLLFAPAFISTFILATNVLEGSTPAESVRKVRSNAPSALVLNWKLWPLAQVITFSVVPQGMQAYWVSVVQLVWNVLLSLQTHA